MFSTNREIQSINAADPYPEIAYGDEEVEGSSSDAEPLMGGDGGEVKGIRATIWNGVKSG
jgi:hypothetical protein